MVLIRLCELVNIRAGLPGFHLVDHSLYSVLDQQKPTGSPEDWVEWFLHRMHQEPWALGGIAVIGVFVLVILSLVIFALLYGCCCSSGDEKTKRRQKNSKDRVI